MVIIDTTIVHRLLGSVPALDVQYPLNKAYVSFNEMILNTFAKLSIPVKKALQHF